MVKVCKFGGSSLADATQFMKVSSIIREDPCRKVIVVSACGKCERESEKITDLLYSVYHCLQEDMEYGEIWKKIEDRYVTIRDELGIDIDIESELEGIYSRLSKDIDEGYLVSRGEYLCALLMAKYLNYMFIDAANVLLFKDHGVLDKEQSRSILNELLEECDGIVIPGFYGSLISGGIYTLGRGGSDVSGALIADLISADIYENWSDVSGVFVVDPRIISDPLKCEYMSYQKARILTYLGANVLHEDTIIPLISQNISLVIRNTNIPQDTGTLISNKDINTNEICGITGKKGYSLLKIYKEHHIQDNTHLLMIIQILTSYNIQIEHISNNIDNYSIILHSSLSDTINTIASKHFTSYEYIPSLSLLGIVGSIDPRRLDKALGYLHDADLVVYHCYQDIDTSTCIMIVKELEEAIRVLYSAFIR